MLVSVQISYEVFRIALSLKTLAYAVSTTTWPGQFSMLAIIMGSLSTDVMRADGNDEMGREW